MNVGRHAHRAWFWPVAFLVMGAAGVFVASRYFFQAFPEASIDLRLTRSEIAQRSNDFLRGRGFSTAGYRQFTMFDPDWTAKTYLERELGLEQADRVMATRVNLWRWKTRVIRPPQKEEFAVWLSTAGDLVGFQHQVDEKLPGARLSMAEAQRVAEVFLTVERRVDLARYELVEDEEKERPNRLDHTFTWEERAVAFKEATPRMMVVVLGDQVGEFREFLKIPEQWTRDYKRLRARNGLLESIAVALCLLLLVGGVITLVRSMRTTRIPWNVGLTIGSVVGVLIAVRLWNDFPLGFGEVPTNFTYASWGALCALLTVLTGIGAALLIVLVIGAGEPLYRALAPERVSLRRLFTFRGMRSREFFGSTLIGYGMAGMHIGLMVLFYVVARRLGAWAPLEVNYNNAISTPAPWIYPLSHSVFTATSQEFAFRLLAIPLLLKWFRSKWLAVLVPALLWGFLHSGGAQQPAWIRGVEVGMIGVVAGWVFLRFGILATLVWRYTVDAVLIGLFLLRSGNQTFRIAGALVGDAVLLPLVIGGVLVLQSRGFVRDPSILNGAAEEEPSAAKIEVADARDASRTAAAGGAAAPAAGPGFTFMRRSVFLGVALAGVAALAILAFVRIPRPGDAVRIQVGPARAEAAATGYLEGIGVKTADFRRTTSLRDSIRGTATDYLCERMKIRDVAYLYGEQIPKVSWKTRFFRPLQKEEYIVFSTPAGDVERYEHQMDETAPGAKLDTLSARARAEALLGTGRTLPPVNLATYQLMEHRVEGRAARTDHTLIWERRQKIAGEATHRISVALQGDEVTGPIHSIKVPEEWERARDRPPSLFSFLPLILLPAIGLGALWLTVKAFNRTTLHGSLHLGLGVAAGLLQLFRLVNGFPGWATNYTTSVPWSTATANAAAWQLMIVLVSFVGVAGLAIVAETLLGGRFGVLALWPARGPGRGRAVLEGLAAGAAAACIGVCATNLLDVGLAGIPSPMQGIESGLPAYPVTFLPGLGVFIQALSGALWMTVLIAALAGFALRVCRDGRVLALALVLVGAALAAGDSLSAVHFAKTWATALVALAAVAAFLPVLRLNIVAWLAMSLVTVSLDPIRSMWRHEALRSMALGLAVGIVMLALVAVGWAIREVRRGVDA